MRLAVWRYCTDRVAVDRFIGVTDIANVRFSLPSQLLEPIPNLGMQAIIGHW